MPESPLSLGQVVVQACLFIVAAIAMFGGALQLCVGSRTRRRAWTTHRVLDTRSDSSDRHVRCVLQADR